MSALDLRLSFAAARAAVAGVAAARRRAGLPPLYGTVWTAARVPAGFMRTNNARCCPRRERGTVGNARSRANRTKALCFFA